MQKPELELSQYKDTAYLQGLSQSTQNSNSDNKNISANSQSIKWPLW